MSIESELEARAEITRAYFDMLREQGFDEQQAFALVRDHAAAFNWFAMVSGEQAPGWLGAPTSNEWSPSTDGVLVSLKPRSTEQ